MSPNPSSDLLDVIWRLSLPSIREILISELTTYTLKTSSYRNTVINTTAAVYLLAILMLNSSCAKQVPSVLDHKVPETIVIGLKTCRQLCNPTHWSFNIALTLKDAFHSIHKMSKRHLILCSTQRTGLTC